MCGFRDIDLVVSLEEVIELEFWLKLQDEELELKRQNVNKEFLGILIFNRQERLKEFLKYIQKIRIE